MKPGDIFRLDNDAIVEMENQEFSVIWRDKQKNEHRLAVGAQFRITREGLLGLPVEVRASKINPTTGKCGRGRPRRFPAAEIYRLFGEKVPEIVEADESTDVTIIVPVSATPAVYDKVHYPKGAKFADQQLQHIADQTEEDANREKSAEAAEKEACKERVAATLASLGLGNSDDEDKDDW